MATEVSVGSDPELAARLDALAARLDERRISLEQRMLLELAHWEGLSGREIAQALEIGENTVRSRLSRARAALREELEKLGAR